MLTRKYQGVRAITAFNNSNDGAQVTVDLPGGDRDKVYQDAVTGRRIVWSNGKLTLTVPAL